MHGKILFGLRSGRFEIAGDGQTRTGELLDTAERADILAVLARHATMQGDSQLGELTIGDDSPDEVIAAVRRMQAPDISRIVNEDLGVHRTTGYVDS